MRTIYRNKIFEDLQKHNIDLNFINTKIDAEEDGKSIFSVIIKNSPLAFSFRNNTNSYEEFDCRFTKYAPSYPSIGWHPRNWVDFNFVFRIFNEWLPQVISYLEDVSQPDLWVEYKKANDFLDFDGLKFDETEEFTEIEKQKTVSAIKELKQLIHQEFPSTDQQKDQVNKKLDYLLNAVNRLNKFDWKSIFASTIFGIITTLTLDVERGNHLWELVKNVFTKIVQISNH